MAKKQEKEAPVAKDYTAIVQPVVTEKSSIVGGAGSCVVFEVSKRATKEDIKQAVERIYKVDVSKVRTMNLLGKIKRRGREVGRSASFKKAYVTLAAGQTIDLVDGL